MSDSPLAFDALDLTGLDAEKFLQGQVTADVSKPADRYTAICDLKGRVQYGLWLQPIDGGFRLITPHDQMDALMAHLRKYSAFSKLHLSAPYPVYPTLTDNQPAFSLSTADATDPTAWQQAAIGQGQAWTQAATAGLFQPQELRLHQRDGVAYDKGCYMGQEIVARLYFRAQPKAWLHRIHGSGDLPKAGQELPSGAQVINAVSTPEGWEALVIAKPDQAPDALALPDSLSGPIGRSKD